MNTKPVVSVHLYEKDNEAAPLTLLEALQLTQSSFTLLSNAISDYKQRPGQLELAEKVCAMAHAKQILVAQAGTGTGKTFAYLLGVLPQVICNKKRAIISTHTVSLQTQLMEKDLPLFLQSVVPSLDLKVAVAKGSSHYFCPKRAHDFISKLESDITSLLLQPEQLSVDQSKLAQVQDLCQQFMDQTFSGDLDCVAGNEITAITSSVNRQYNRCPGQRACGFGEKCPYYNALDEQRKAHIVITNHALLAHELIHETQCLGVLHEHILVVDEAHQFLSIYRHQQERAINLSEELKMIAKLGDMDKSLNIYIRHQGSKALPFDESIAQRAFQQCELLLEEVETQFSALSDFLWRNFPALRGEIKNEFDDPTQWLMGFENTPDELATRFAEIYSLLSSAMRSFAQISNDVLKPLERCYAHSGDKAQKQIASLAIATNDLEQQLSVAHECLERYVRHDQLYTISQRAEAGLVRWIRKEEFTKDTKQLVIYSNLLNVKASINEKLLSVFDATIFTSATINALNSPAQFLGNLGLDERSDVHFLDVASPFNYANVSLEAPIKYGDVNHPKYSVQILQQLEKAVLRHKSIMLLFSSYNQLNQVYQQCPSKLQRMILRQCDFNSKQLLITHKLRIDDNKTSILFGVDGLSEGIDLKGHYLTCVMIAKFPFPNMNEPMYAHEARTIEFYGKSSFWELAMPLCSRKLIQGTGRLIRSEQDFGEVILLDSRIHTKQYAKNLIYSLPFYKH